MQDPEWSALDADRDGRVRLIPGRFEFERLRGFLRDGSEWPRRREYLFPLPPGMTTERMLELFDHDGDQVLSRGELEDRSDLRLLMDRDRDGEVSLDELRRLIETLDRRGVDACPDDFIGRWDMDGSGRVEPEELPESVRLRLQGVLARD